MPFLFCDWLYFLQEYDINRNHRLRRGPKSVNFIQIQGYDLANLCLSWLSYSRGRLLTGRTIHGFYSPFEVVVKTNLIHEGWIVVLLIPGALFIDWYTVGPIHVTTLTFLSLFLGFISEALLVPYVTWSIWWRPYNTSCGWSYSQLSCVQWLLESIHRKTKSILFNKKRHSRNWRYSVCLVCFERCRT